MESFSAESPEKKILIITPYAPPAPSGSGLMIFNLLQFFPKGSYAIVTEYNDINPSLSGSRLPAQYYYYGTEIDTSKSTFIHPNAKKGFLQNTIKKLPGVNFLAQTVLLIVTVAKIIRTGKRAIEKENPDIIVGYSDIGNSLLATLALSLLTGKPYALFFYDLYLGNKLPAAYHVAAKMMEPFLIRRASRLFVMCDPLKNHYGNKYSKKEITIIYNSLTSMSPEYKEESVSKNSFTILYLGNIYWAQEQTLNNLIEAIKGITTLPVKLLLYTGVSKDELAKKGIEENELFHIDTCLPEEVPALVKTVDLLFCGLSFDTAWPNLINTSSPGRLCDFLKAPTPMLIHAPKDSFVSMYARENDFGYVVDENSVELLRKEILSIAATPEVSKNKIENANKVGIKNHLAITNAKLYYSTLVEDLHNTK